MLELSGFFGGSLSLARSSAFSFRNAEFSARSVAFSARNAAFSASKASMRLVRSFRRSNTASISASFPALSRRLKSGSRVIHRLTHIRSLDASLFSTAESICRTPPATTLTPPKGGVSNYHQLPDKWLRAAFKEDSTQKVEIWGAVKVDHKLYRDN
jgi:hypothetical protein